MFLVRATILYKFNQTANFKVWFKIYINNIVVDSVGFNNTIKDIIYTYNKTFTTPIRNKLFINFQGLNGPARIGVDDLVISKYDNILGCSVLPLKIISFKIKN